MTEYMITKIFKHNGKECFEKIKANNPTDAYKKLMKRRESYNYQIRTKRDHTRFVWNEFLNSDLGFGSGKNFTKNPYRYVDWNDLPTHFKKEIEQDVWNYEGWFSEMYI